jgi:hypothetical protein
VRGGRIAPETENTAESAGVDRVLRNSLFMSDFGIAGLEKENTTRQGG